jgi:hypothetical protein
MFSFNLKDNSLSKLAQLCPDLQKLELINCRGIDDVDLSNLALHCKNIWSIKTGVCTRVTDAGIRELTIGCSQLEVVDIKYRRLSDEGIRSFARCSQLRELKTGDAENVSVEAVTELVQHRGEQLEKFEFACRNLNEDTLVIIANGCPNVTELKLECDSISDRGFDAVISACTKLTVLGLGSCISLTDESLVKFSQRRPNMNNIDLSGCARITDIGLRALLLGCQSLEDLYVSWVDTIPSSKEALGTLAAEFPKVSMTLKSPSQFFRYARRYSGSG